jgi:cytochrome P450
MGSMPQFRQSPLDFIMDVHRRVGDVARFRMGHVNAYLVRHPEDVHHVLVKNHGTYGKKTIGYEKLRLFLGQGLVTSEGEFWRRQRRIAQPAFHRKRIASFAQVMSDMADDMVRGWQPAIDRGQPVDMSPEMMRVTLRVIANTLLSIDVERRERDIADAISELLEMFERALGQVLPIHEKLPTRTHRRWQAAMDVLNDLVNGTIAERRSSGARSEDLLDMLMYATDEETGERMTDQQLRDEVMTMFVAGHETTANALSWTMYELSRHPEVVAKLHAELDTVLEGRNPRLEDLPKLAYTGQVFDEAMRLHPPVWLLARSVHGQDELRGMRINEGSYLFISQYAVHRHPEFWPDPERFDPERFAPEAKKRRHRYAFIPFSAGPRICIGNQFAEMEGRLILARMMRDLDVSLAPGQTIVPEPIITLRPRDGVKLRLTPRVRH